MKIEINFKKLIFTAVGLSIAVKILFFILSRAYLNIQAFEYESIASNMLKGIGFCYDHFNTKYYASHPPGFPVLCYLVYKIFGHNQSLIVFIQIISTSLVVLPVAYMARKIFDEKTAVLAGFLTALYPPFIIYSTMKLHTMNIDALFFALGAYSFMRLRENACLKNSVYTGIYCGLAFLFRTTVLLFVMLGLLWLYITLLGGMKKKLSLVFVAFFTFAIVISPWVIRNYVIYKNPFILSTNVSECLWYGNMPGSTGSLYAAHNITMLEKGGKELPPHFFELNETGQTRYLNKLTAGYFKSDPKGFIVRILKKMCYFWGFSPNQGALYPPLWMKLYKAYYFPILLCALFSVVHGMLSKNIDMTYATLVFVLFLSFTVINAVYYVEARHRWAIEPFLLIFAANGIVSTPDIIIKKKKKETV